MRTTPSAGGAHALGIAVAGLGMGMQRAQLVAATPGARLAAVCDTNPARLAEARARFGCPAFSDYDEMLGTPGIDCIYVMTPTHLHLPFAEAAAHSGRHVLLTKPMETTPARAQAIRAACSAAGVKLVLDHELRYDPVMRQVKAAVAAGALGRLLTVEARLQWFRGADYYRPPRGTRAGDGGGVFAIQAVHLLDQIAWLAGAPTEAHAFLDTLEKPIEVEDYGVVHLHFADPGLRGLAVASTLFGTDVQFGLVLAGTLGSVDTTRALHGEHRRGPEWFFRDGRTAEPVPPPSGPANAVEDLVACVREGKRPECEPESGLQGLLLLDAIYRSAATGRPCPVDTVPSPVPPSSKTPHRPT